jgi:hypothetical protein
MKSISSADEDDYSLAVASPRASFGSSFCWEEDLEEDWGYLLVRLFLEGGLAVDWQFAQQRYFKPLRSMKSGRRWVSALIRKLWTVAWDQWEHRGWH